MRKLIAIIAALTLMLSGCAAAEPLPLMRIAVLDIGKADCIIIKAGDGCMMIDTGLDDSAGDILTKLDDMGVSDIDYLILTHMDKDHIGGADKILNAVPVGKLIAADYSKDSKQYSEYVEAAAKLNITPTALEEEISFELNGASVRLTPAKYDYYEQSNDYSIIVDMAYGDRTFLFMGDAEKIRINEFLDVNSLKYDYVKMPHHGGAEDNTDDFIKSTSPKYAVITCSQDDPPDAETLALLKKYGASVYLTSDGEVNAACDGYKLELNQAA